MDCRCTIRRRQSTVRILSAIIPYTDTSSLSTVMTQCVDSISGWMCSNPLQLNPDKTEVMWCSTARKLTQLPSCPLSVACALVRPVTVVWDLGIFIDNDLGAVTHVWRIVSRCFAALRQLRHLRRYITDDCFHSLVVSLVLLDSTTATSSWSGFLPTSRDNFSQCSTLRLVWCTDFVDAITLQSYTDALATLHWLRLPERVDFKVAVMAFRVLHGFAPPYLNQLVRVADLPGRRRLRRSSTSYQLHVPSFRL